MCFPIIISPKKKKNIVYFIVNNYFVYLDTFLAEWQVVVCNDEGVTSAYIKLIIMQWV